MDMDTENMENTESMECTVSTGTDIMGMERNPVRKEAV